MAGLIRLSRSAFVVWCFLLCSVVAHASERDEYLRGYVAAVLQREFDVRPDAVSVKDGVVVIRADLSQPDAQRLRRILRNTDGVRDIVLQEASTTQRGWTWLPGTSPFRPLVADPRWPRFGAAFQRYIDGDDGAGHDLGNVGAANFGAHLPLLRHSPSYGGSWDVGVQAGVFAIFDFDRSFDLINADYVAGVPIIYGNGNFASMLRVFHQSSHLGDEYLLRGAAVRRVNLSYEAVQLLLSYDLPFGIRPYAGGAYIFRIEPSNIDRWRTQGGIEYLAPSLSRSAGVRPLLAVDVQVEQEGGWKANVAPIAGLRFERRYSNGPDFQVVLQYFRGRSPNGQFYERDVQYVGLAGEFYLF